MKSTHVNKRTKKHFKICSSLPTRTTNCWIELFIEGWMWNGNLDLLRYSRSLSLSNFRYTNYSKGQPLSIILDTLCFRSRPTSYSQVVKAFTFDTHYNLYRFQQQTTISFWLIWIVGLAIYTVRKPRSIAQSSQTEI